MDGARNRLLEAADRCFERTGITATGVSELLAEASVARMSLYHHFGSKDQLVVAYLQRRHHDWVAHLEEHLTHIEEPTDRLITVVEAYAWHADQPGFRGCVFLNAAAELASDHPAWTVIRDHKTWVQTRLQELATTANIPRPEDLAQDLFMVTEGAIAAAGVERDPSPLNAAKRTARELIARHTDAAVPG